MKRSAVIKKLKAEAKRRGLEFEEIPLSRHDAYRVGSTTKTLGRHREIDDLTARKFFDQFAHELGKGWWR
ncbi:ribonuclease PH [Corynebacterium oculi]|uniref:ribonuclease PH n=1 Tax=Corynebacterium oculi TaxID=1544416 RepID=UPI0009EBEF8B|nr:ribonuclease PH [Corynebacterium oculi]